MHDPTRFPTTNNEAEYKALVARLDLVKAASVENMIVHCDSQVITSQINGDYECRNERMKKYLEEVKSRISSLEVKFVQIPREETNASTVLQKQLLQSLRMHLNRYYLLSKPPRLLMTEHKCGK